jgi:predicted Zn-dependent peptidase/outer membrane lipoprotein-sorting protein
MNSSSAQKYYKDIKYPKLNDIKIPKVEQVTLDNGMRVFLLEDPELPLINVSARIRVGSIYEPAEKIGLAAITGEVMRTGGTTSKTGDEIDELLESIAASVETSIGLNSGTASMSVLKKDVDTGLSILADVLMNPAFRDDKIELAKVQQRSVIARRNDNVNALAFREFQKLIYGPQSVYARHTEYATIDNITRDDLIAFHKKFFHPNTVILGVWGDFKTKEMIKKIKNAFKNWKKVELNYPPVPEVNYEFKPTVNLIRKEDVNQTNIFVGHIGGKRDNPDYFALILMNRILGQGFTSRLFRNVRSRQGLAYSVFGVYSANYDYPGVLYVGCQTKSETTVQAIRALMQEIKKMTESEVTEEELALAKDSYLNSFVFNFDSKGEIVNRLMTYEYFGYPQDFLQKSKENIEKVTQADILRVASNYLHPEAMQILAVGRPDDFDEPLSVFGTVNDIDITIPVPKEEVPEATDETLTKGRDILNKAISASGGSEAFKAIKTLQWKGDITAVTPQGEMALSAQVIIALPDRMRANVNTPMGAMSQIMNGDQAWIISPQGTMPAPAPMKEQMVANLWRNVSYLFANAENENLTAQYLGSEEVQGQNNEVLLITPPGVKAFKLYLDAETMLPVKMSYQGVNMMGAPVASEEMFSDYREVSGVKLPFKSVTNQDGKRAQEVTAAEININVEVDEGQFVVKQ